MPARPLFRLGVAALIWLATIGTAQAAPSIAEYTSGITGNQNPTSITAGPDGNLWFTETADPADRADHPGRRRSPSSPTGLPTAATRRDRRRARTATCGSPRADPGRIGRITPDGRDHRVHAGLTPDSAARRASPPGPTATSGSPRRRTRRSAGSRRRARSPSSRRPDRGSSRRRASPPAPTATSGSPSRPTRTGSAGSPRPGADHRVRTGLTPSRSRPGHHRRPRRQPLVHRAASPAGSAGSRRPASITEFADRARPPTAQPSASPPGPTATSGSPSRPTRPDRPHHHRPGSITEFTTGLTANAQPGRHRGRSRTATSGSPSRPTRAGSAESPFPPASRP